jgi:hypothetical protein
MKGMGNSEVKNLMKYPQRKQDVSWVRDNVLRHLKVRKKGVEDVCVT